MNDLDEGRRKLRTLAYVAKVFIVIAVIAAMVDMVTVLAPSALGDLNYNDPELGSVWLSDLAVLLSAIPVAMWIYRAHANLDAADLPGLEYTPGWSVGWFFIPFASLWKPFSAMRELWNASHGAVGDYSETAPALLWVWWLCWVFRGIAGLGAIDYTLEVLGTGVMIASASALWMIVDIVTRRQESFGLGEVFA